MKKNKVQQTTFLLLMSLFTLISWRPWSMEGLCASKNYTKLQQWQ